MRLEDVWLRYRRRGSWVLRAVDVEIGPGEAAVVLGRNGAGKSTPAPARGRRAAPEPRRGPRAA